MIRVPKSMKAAQHDEWFYASKPTRWTLFLRTFLPWQLWRFVWINARMLGMIGRGRKS